ncbi:hypothetical protein J437_LFUL010032 [Ladona fulva]|uniref:Uncharacterized protein n=1 Tax=Ladona fulva TaxID=123851 RepID=A0A8K0P2D6_LADFU|nr:hypothetical protein J437_LFUL010032 [Ladona fulva]
MQKIQGILRDPNYQNISCDPTDSLMRRTSLLLKQSGLPSENCKGLLPQALAPPRLYWITVSSSLGHLYDLLRSMPQRRCAQTHEATRPSQLEPQWMRPPLRAHHASERGEPEMPGSRVVSRSSISVPAILFDRHFRHPKQHRCYLPSSWHSSSSSSSSSLEGTSRREVLDMEVAPLLDADSPPVLSLCSAR